MYYSDKAIRILELNKEKKPTLQPIEVMLEGKNRKEALKDIVINNGLAGKKVCACVSVNDGLLKFYKYPVSMTKKDLQSAIEWSIKRELSAMKEETYYDYYVINPRPEDKQRGVVIVLSRKETVETLKNTLEEVGLRLQVLDYEVVSIINYGIYHSLPVPFTILYVDYNYSILTTYSPINISYYVTHWSFLEFLSTKDEESAEAFLTEIRNIVVLNDLSNMYVAGPILAQEEVLMRVMENLPVMGLLDLEDLPPQFFIPYTLSIRGMAG
ncbi:MAG: pilus assembly protein PilM [Aquificaceae bacterium]|nr:pilus assembly protein PilM [Aquificaceae bacterium]